MFASETADDARVVTSHLENLQRSEISTPPAFGARVASTILQDPELRAVWKADLKRMSARLAKMRQRLYQELKSLGMQMLIIPLILDLAVDFTDCPQDFSHVVEQVGMFCILGLSVEQVRQLKGTLIHIIARPRAIPANTIDCRPISHLHGRQLKSVDCGIE